MSNGKKNGTKVGAAAKYSWSMDTGGVICFRDQHGGQTVSILWEADESPLFHDKVLMKATKEINAILGKVNKDNKDKKRKLSLIEFENRHVLVWATYEGVVSSNDDEAMVRKALKLKK